MKRIQERLHWPVIVLTVLFLISCGGGSSSTGAWTSSLERGTIVGSINAGERVRVCKEFTDWWRGQVSQAQLCTFSGLVFTTFLPGLLEQQGFSENVSQVQSAPQACGEFVDLCTSADGTDDSDEVEVDCVLNEVDKLKSCGATVDELDVCLNDSLIIIEQVFSAASCQFAGNIEAVTQQFEAVSNVPPSLACESVKAKCPELFKQTDI